MSGPQATRPPAAPGLGVPPVAVLDPLTHPLAGMHAISASAGTGKTWTLAALVARAVLGHGLPAAVPIDQIVVVTFTVAAAGELRARIRQRLAGLLGALRGPAADGDAGDAFAAALLADLADRALARRQLERALADIDTAPIHTIHAWCLRLLAEHAFDAGLPFERTFVLDDSDRRAAALHDFWRRVVVARAGDGLMALLDQWPDPAALAAAIAPLLRGPGHRVAGTAPDVDDAIATVVATLAGWRQAWLGCGAREAIAASSASRAVNGGRPSLGHPDRLAELDAFARAATGGQAIPPRLEQLLPGNLLGNANGQFGRKARLPAGLEPLAEASAALLAACAALRGAVLGAAARAVRDASGHAARDAGEVGPDQLLLDTAAALRSRPGLAARLRARWPLALVDEFQDTDPVQLAIFAALYAGRDDCGWHLIGDPKQAIYAFRGADVQAFLDAEAAATARHALVTNRRTVAPLVDALDAVWSAWPAPFIDPRIHWQRVDAAPVDAALLCRDGVPAPVLTFLHEPDEAGATEVGDRLAERTAAQVAALLGGAGWTIGVHPVAGRDIAVLVRTNDQADQVRAALARRGISSAMQHRASVWQQPVAADVVEVLRAVLAPRDGERVRTALATRLVGLAAADLRALAEDPARWEAVLESFGQLHQTWRQAGVLSMLLRFVAHWQVPQHWLADPLAGPRVLTDLRHVGELLQQAQAGCDGMHALLRHAEQSLARAGSSDDELLRLDSDEDLVTIVTVHRAKGLEYDLVLVPFAGMWMAPREVLLPPAEPDPAVPGQRELHLDPGPAARAAADAAALAEDMRLLYVALTRARKALWIGVAPVSARGANGRPGWRLPDTALGRWLFGGRPDAADGASADAVHGDRFAEGQAAALQQRLAELVAIDGVAVASATDAAAAMDAAAETALPVPPAGAARTDLPRLDSHWRVLSYTALAAGGGAADDSPPGLDDERHGDAAGVPPGAEPGAAAPAGPAAADAVAEAVGVAATLVRGAQAGVFLHEVLERWPGDDGPPGADGPRSLERVRTALVRHGLAATGVDPVAVHRWLETVRATPLDGPGSQLTLARVTSAVAELEFQFPLRRHPVRELAALLRRFGHAEPPDSGAVLEGMMKGFIDLLVLDQGRWRVIDYKSTWLGPAPAAYDAAAMTADVRSHAYDLQMLIYLVAARRFLRQRLGRAAADHGCQGAQWLYLRGMDGSGRHGVHTLAADPRVLDALDDLFGAAGGEFGGDGR